MCPDHDHFPYGRLAALLLFLAILTGCGNREAQTGSIQGRVINPKGDLVAGAKVWSLFNEVEQVYTGLDGGFYLSELPAGRNRVVIQHSKYRLTERVIEVQSDVPANVGEIRVDWATASQVLYDVAVESTTSSTAVVTWKTGRPALCTLDYGISMGYGSSVREESSSSDHRLTIPGLIPETVYHLRVGFTDEVGAIWYSYDLPFKTQTSTLPAPPERAWIDTLRAYGEVVVNWAPSTSTSAIGYRVYRRDGSASGTVNATWESLHPDELDRNTRTFRDLTARGGHFYVYAVTAITGLNAESLKTQSERVFMPGYIEETMILNAADSPIPLVSDLVVAPGVSLYADPGVEFRVAASDAFRIGLDQEKVELLVNGRIAFNGASGSPIRFTPLVGGGVRNLWAGINLRNGGTGNSEISWVELSGCRDWAVTCVSLEPNVRDLTVRFSGGGLRFTTIRNLPEITNCTFADLASTAILLENCRRVAISNCTMTDVGAGIRNAAVNLEDRLTVRECEIGAREEGIGGRFSRSILANNIIVSRNGIGVNYEVASQTENILDHCTIDASIGVLVKADLPTIENNLFVNLQGNGRVGIRYLPVGVPQFAYNNLTGFAVPYEGCAGGAGALALETQFIAGNPYDYHLLGETPLKHSDRNGLQMGRYGQSFY